MNNEPMTHSEKVEYHSEDLRKRGIEPEIAKPLLYRLLWRLGWEVSPPLFQDFRARFLIAGTFCGIVWGIVHTL